MIKNLLTISITGIILIVSIIGGTIYLTAHDPVNVETIEVANQLYKDGEFATATQVYEHLLSQGQANSTIYYNLGNAYYIQGDIGRAILNYQRASRIDPRDPDIRANLALARQQVGNDITKFNNPLEGLASFTGSWLTLNETGLITLSLWFLLGFLIFVYRQLQPGRVRTLTLNAMFLTLLFLLAAGVSFGSRLYVERTRSIAVITDDLVTINASPEKDTSTEFSLASGAEVNLLDIKGNWAKLVLPNDVIEGWIPISAFETVSLKPTPSASL